MILCLLCISNGTWAKGKKTKGKVQPEYYEAYYQSEGNNENIVLRIECYSPSVQDAKDKAELYVVKALLFKDSKDKKGALKVRALVDESSLSPEQSVYFDAFFNSGKYHKYIVSLIPGTFITTKIKKQKQVKVSSVFSVNRRALRHDLETDGVIEKLGGMFNRHL